MTTKNSGLTWDEASENVSQSERRTSSCAGDNVVIAFPQPLSAPRQLSKHPYPYLEKLTLPDGTDIGTVIRMPDGAGISVDHLPLAYACLKMNEGKAATLEEALAMVPGLHRYEWIANLGLVAMAMPVRPGISEATLQKAGVSYDDYPYPGSIKIPYHSITGVPRLYTDLNGKDQHFARWRLPKQFETPEKKYHQPKGSPQFAYHLPIPITIADLLALFEGEFKFLSGHEEGLAGLGLPSFWVYTKQNDTRILLPEIGDAIRTAHPQKILFFGDADTATNLFFSMSALFLAQAIKPLPVYLPRLCVAGPKGFDDLKEALKGQFRQELDRLITQAYLINPEIFLSRPDSRPDRHCPAGF